MEFKPMGNWIGIIPDEVSKQTKNGLMIPETAQKEPRTGVIVSLPIRSKTNDEFWKDGEYAGMCVGDRVLYYEHGGTKYKEQYFLKLSEIIAIWEK